VEVLSGGTTIGTTTSNGAGSWSFDYTGKSLADGTYKLKAQATDIAGNTGAYSSTFTVVVDTVAPGAPAITFIVTDSGATGDGLTNDNTLTFKGTSGPNEDITLYKDGVAFGTTTANGSGNWSINKETVALVDGNYVFTAKASDIAGNTSSASADFNVTVDTSIDATIITGITNDDGVSSTDGVTTDATLVINGTADKGSTVTVKIDGAIIGTSIANAMTGVWSYDYTGTTLSGGSHTITANAEDGAGTVSATANFPIQILVLPSITSSASFSVPENSTPVGTITATNPNSGTLHFTLGGTDKGSFTLDANTGVLAFATAPNFEAPADSGANNVYDITVTVDDGFISASQNVTVTVTNVNDGPTITGGTGSVSVAENSTAVTTVTASDEDAGTTLTFMLSGTDASYFNISKTGDVTFKVAPNYEADPHSYSFDVTVSDGSLTDTKSVTVTVTDVNEFAPTVSGGPFSIDENSANSTVVGSVSGSDADGTNGGLTYSITGGNGLGIFAINSSTGAITVFDNTKLDRESISSVTLTVQVSDNGPGTAKTGSTSVTINVNDVNEFSVTTPTDTDATANAVNENVASGTPVGITVNATDADATTNTVTYSLTNDAGGLFAIDATTGVVTVLGSDRRETAL